MKQVLYGRVTPFTLFVNLWMVYIELTQSLNQETIKTSPLIGIDAGWYPKVVKTLFNQHLSHGEGLFVQGGDGQGKLEEDISPYHPKLQSILRTSQQGKVNCQHLVAANRWPGGAKSCCCVHLARGRCSDQWHHPFTFNLSLTSCASALPTRTSW